MLSTPLLYLSQVLSRFFRHPLVRQLGRRFPRAYTFLQNRLNLRHFFGLPFTLIIFLITYNLLLLTQLSQKLVNSPGLKAIDTQISLAFYLLREPWLSKAFYLFTQLGSYYGLLAIGGLACIVLIIKRKPYYLLGLLVSILGSGLAVRITKAYFVRERPLEIAYYPEHSFSFPSGHATGGVALEGFICYLFMLEAGTMRGKLFLAANRCDLQPAYGHKPHLPGRSFRYRCGGGLAAGFLLAAVRGGNYGICSFEKNTSEA